MPKICSKCKESYPSDIKYFPRKYSAKDGLYPNCRACENKRHSKRYYDCKESWLSNHPEEEKVKQPTTNLSFIQYFP
jgi:hypothetical protein